jgi:hypothetical protein
VGPERSVVGRSIAARVYQAHRWAGRTRQWGQWAVQLDEAVATSSPDDSCPHPPSSFPDCALSHARRHPTPSLSHPTATRQDAPAFARSVRPPPNAEQAHSLTHTPPPRPTATTLPGLSLSSTKSRLAPTRPSAQKGVAIFWLRPTGATRSSPLLLVAPSPAPNTHRPP